MNKMQDALLRLANTFAKHHENRTHQESRLTNNGICWGLDCLDFEEAYDMGNMTEIWPEYNTYEGDEQRAFFCLFLALMPPKDFRELWDYLSKVEKVETVLWRSDFTCILLLEKNT